MRTFLLHLGVLLFLDGGSAFQPTARYYANPATLASVQPKAAATVLFATNDNNNEYDGPKSFMNRLGSLVLAASLALGTASATTLTPTAPFAPLPAHAAESKVIGELKGSGLVFKDVLTIERFDDPKVKGVTLYISNFDRPLTEKLGKNFFSDPSAASVGCAKTGPVAVADNINKSKQGEEVFEESKSLLFKTLRVQRIFDVEKNTIVYVTFATRLDKSDDSNNARFKSSVCAVSLDEPTLPVIGEGAAAAPAATP